MNLFGIPVRKIYQDEKKYSWLKILLDSFAICDYETGLFVRRQEEIKKAKVACHKGCANCCKNHSVPVSHLEMRGISWFVTEIMEFENQEKLKSNILNPPDDNTCPFLLEDSCSIYEVRPLACRGFYVFNENCSAEEDPIKTRPFDILPPNPKIGKKVAMRFLDDEFYNLHSKKEKEKAFEDEIMMKTARMLHQVNWNQLISMIEAFQKIRFQNGVSD